MYVYAGIDEAGYGPMFGPLVVGRSVFRIPKLAGDSSPPHLWQRLSKAVGRQLNDRQGRVIVNDSKKLTTRASGVKHLERGCLAFAGLSQPNAVHSHEPASSAEAWKPAVHDSQRAIATVGQWLEAVGGCPGDDLAHLPWYAHTPNRPWEPLPCANTAGELAIARSMVGRTCERIGVHVGSLAADVVFEDHFNQQVRQTGSKAVVNWHAVAGHLRQIWLDEGVHEPTVVVDRLGGRRDYHQPLAQAFAGCRLRVLKQSPANCGYHLRSGDRAMTVWFQINSESNHLPVALASMTAKYTRELLMSRFKDYFAQHAPGVRPTAGYGRDAQRFWGELRPHLSRLRIEANHLRRLA